jgi:hypothetical protein
MKAPLPEPGAAARVCGYLLPLVSPRPLADRASVEATRARRNYIFFGQIVGTDPTPVPLPAVHDPSITIEGLPAHATVKVSAQAVNGVGKSDITGPVETTLSA